MAVGQCLNWRVARNSKPFTASDVFSYENIQLFYQLVSDFGQKYDQSVLIQLVLGKCGLIGFCVRRKLLTQL